MRRLTCAVCVALGLGGLLVRAQNTYPCATVVSVDARTGSLIIQNPTRMQCAVGESISLTFVNEDPDHAHRFVIASIGCKDGSNPHNPAKRFTNVPILVPAAGTRILDESFLLFFRRRPAILGRGDASKLKCASVTEPWLYEYTILVGDADNINNHSVKLDPDLEISPAP